MKTKTDQLTNNQKVKNNGKYKQWETYIYIYIYNAISKLLYNQSMNKAIINRAILRLKVGKNNN